MVFQRTTLGMVGTDCIGSFKANYHTITGTKAPYYLWKKGIFFLFCYALNYNFFVGRRKQNTLVNAISVWFSWWCLTRLLTIFLLYRSGQFYWRRKPEYPATTTDLSQVSDTLSNNVVSSTPRSEQDRNHSFSDDRHWVRM